MVWLIKTCIPPSPPTPTKLRLQSGAVTTVGAISISFFRFARDTSFGSNPPPPPLPGGNNPPLLFRRVMECLGSGENTATFSFVHEDINAIKGQVGLVGSLLILTAQRDKKRPKAMLTCCRWPA